MVGPLIAAAQARIAAEPHSVTYIDFLTVTLTALCALLAALAAFIALVAVYGYYGLRNEVSKAVTKRAEEALAKKLSEYPDSAKVLELFNEMRDFHEQQKQLSSLLLTRSEAKTVAQASKKVQDKGKDSGPFAKDYPGKGK